MHLQPDELVDLAEGTRAESSAPHLAACEVCRRHLADLRTMMSTAADVDVPEPSPLFWDHLSARVRDAVAAAGTPRRPFWTWPRLVLPGAVVALTMLLLAARLNTGRDAAPIPVAPAPLPVASADLPYDSQSGGLLGDPQTTDDTALTLVAELSSDMDFDGAREAGLAARGSAEHAVTHLNSAELRELQRLLQEELAHSGA
jgi:hypothetical protein